MADLEPRVVCGPGAERRWMMPMRCPPYSENVALPEKLACAKKRNERCDVSDKRKREKA
jgi:hypothetical protein